MSALTSINDFFSTLQKHEAVTVFTVFAVLAFWFSHGGSPAQVLKYLQRRLNGWRYLISGATIISDSYIKSHGAAFEVPGPDVDMVFISSPLHLNDMRKAKCDELSLFAATRQMWQPVYTMLGHNWLDIRGPEGEGLGYVRAVGSLLPRQLPKMMPSMVEHIHNRFQEECKESRGPNGEYTMPLYVLIKKMVNQLNGLCFFGEELVHNAQFMDAIYEYNEIVMKYGEALRLMPDFLKRIVGPRLKNRGGIQEYITDTLEKVVKARMDQLERRKTDPTVPPLPADLITWIMQTAPPKLNWSARRITFEVVTIWFGSVHALSVTLTFAIYDLCLHKEYLEPLRNEAFGPEYQNLMKTTRGMPLMDSFLKESSRLNPLEAMAGRRQALKDFRFSDGVTVNKGTWTCIPTDAILHDEKFFPDATNFNGFRFANPEKIPGNINSVSQPEGPSNFVDISPNYHSWGIGGITCPGRFYVGTASKLIMSYIIRNFDCSLVDEKSPRTFIWRSYILPKEDTMVRFIPTKRQDI